MDGPVCRGPGRVSVCFRTSAVARTFGLAVSEEYSPVVFAGGGGGGCRCIHPGGLNSAVDGPVCRGPGRVSVCFTMSAVARTFGPAVSEEYSPVVFAGGGGGVADAYPLVDSTQVSGLRSVVSDSAQVSGLQLVGSDTARVSVLPVAGCEFPAVFLGKVAFDAVGLGVGPPCFRVDSEEALLKRTDERAPLACAAPGGFGGSFAEANRRASPVGLCCPRCDPGGEVVNEILDGWSTGDQ